MNKCKGCGIYIDDMDTICSDCISEGCVIDSDGNVIWFNSNGKLHRLDGPAIEWNDGSKFWYRHGQLHREDGPAVEHADGSKYWYRHGQLHRLDGPAIEWNDGSKFWYLDDKEYTEKKFNKKMGILV